MACDEHEINHSTASSRLNVKNRGDIGRYAFSQGSPGKRNNEGMLCGGSPNASLNQGIVVIVGLGTALAGMLPLGYMFTQSGYSKSSYTRLGCGGPTQFSELVGHWLFDS